MNDNFDNIFYTQPVGEAEKAERLDKFLAKVMPSLSRSQAQRLIVSGNVVCDDATIADNSFKVRVGDVYQIFIPEATDAEPEPENIPLDVVFEDEDLLVVNKPAGMTVHPALGAYSGTLVNALLYHCRDNLSGIGGVKRPGIVHRIDKDTSGLLVVAKNDLAHQGLCAQFFEHSIERTYYAVVYGLPNPLSGRIEKNIGRSRFDRKKMAVLENGGKFAATNYKTLENFNGAAALVQCNLETGRTHQIRVHMASIGCNLVGDQLYVKSKKTSLKGLDNETMELVNHFPRQALHAASLGFIHPRSGKKLQFFSDFPDDIQNLLAKLRREVSLKTKE